MDLKSQSKNVDFSGVTADVKPFPVGTSLPATCATGSMFFKSNQPSGENLYGCVAPNTWALQAGGSGGGGGGAEIPLKVEKTGSTISIGVGCSITTPCLARIGSVAYAYLGQATVTVTSGTGNAMFYVDRDGQLIAAVAAAGSPNIGCSGCQALTGVTQVPGDGLPLAVWHATAGVWDAAGTDQRAILSAGSYFTAGPNVSVSHAGSNVTISAFLAQLPSGTQAACSSTTQGTIWYTPGAMGVKDKVEVCAKDDTDVYAWRLIY